MSDFVKKKKWLIQAVKDLLPSLPAVRYVSTTPQDPHTWQSRTYTTTPDTLHDLSSLKAIILIDILQLLVADSVTRFEVLTVVTAPYSLLGWHHEVW